MLQLYICYSHAVVIFVAKIQMCLPWQKPQQRGGWVGIIISWIMRILEAVEKTLESLCLDLHKETFSLKKVCRHVENIAKPQHYFEMRNTLPERLWKHCWIYRREFYKLKLFKQIICYVYDLYTVECRCMSNPSFSSQLFTNKFCNIAETV